MNQLIEPQKIIVNLKPSSKPWFPALVILVHGHMIAHESEHDTTEIHTVEVGV